jgi:hypothetical protein
MLVAQWWREHIMQAMLAFATLCCTHVCLPHVLTLRTIVNAVPP